MTTDSSLERLAASVAQMQIQIDQQQQRIAQLQGRLESAQSARRASRLRALVPVLTLLCALLWGAAALGTTQAQTSVATGAGDADKAASPQTTGGPLLIGSTINQATAYTDTTRLRNPSSVSLMRRTFVSDNYSDGSIVDTLLDANVRAGIVGSVSGVDATSGNFRAGVIGLSDRGYGVYGASSGGGVVGVFGEAKQPGGVGVSGAGGAFGGAFSGTLAPLILQPNASPGPPTLGDHFVGELRVSSDGHLYFCRASGTPGVWVRLDLFATNLPLVSK